MRALLFHAPAYTADGYDDTRPRLVRAACKGSDNNVERRDIPENGLSVSDWYLRNILYIDARSHERERERERDVYYTPLRAHETLRAVVCRVLL